MVFAHLHYSQSYFFCIFFYKYTFRCFYTEDRAILIVTNPKTFIKALKLIISHKVTNLDPDPDIKGGKLFGSGSVRSQHVLVRKFTSGRKRGQGIKKHMVTQFARAHYSQSNFFAKHFYRPFNFYIQRTELYLSYQIQAFIKTLSKL